VKRYSYYIQFLIGILGTGLSFISCTHPVNITPSKLKVQVVVNCLFNPDSSWKVSVEEIKTLSDSGKVYKAVPNAMVRIFEGNIPFSLDYQTGGNYIALNKKPKINVNYKLEVDVPGYSTITASGNIPTRVAVDHIDYDSIPSYFVPDNGFDNVKVNQVNITLHLPKQPDQHYELLAYKYNIDAYCDFIVTEKVLNELINYQLPDEMAGSGLSEEYINDLKYFEDVPIRGKDNFLNMIARHTGTSSGGYLVYEFSEKVRHSPKVYDSSKFIPAELFSKDLRFYNITGDSHGVFGTYTNSIPAGKDTATLFLSDLSYTGNTHNGQDVTEQNEGWLEIWSMSEAMYKYQTSYVNQMLNEQNPFAQPVQVYSNIHNGIGIFAGYQTERVKLH